MEDFEIKDGVLIKYRGNKKIVEIPEGVTSIRKYSFGGHPFLSDIVKISDAESVIIPNGVIKIDDFAFWFCSNLKTIKIPVTVTSIGDNAFSGCSSLTSITIPDSVTSIESSTFKDCSSLTSITIPDSVKSIGEYAFSGCSSLTSITIPDSVKTIGKCAFYDCTHLTSIAFPNSVRSIGSSTFSGCSSLTSIAIPDSVTSIGEYAFSGCSSLKRINSDVDGVFNIPKGVVSIGKRAFKYCDALEIVFITSFVKKIGEEVFSNCKSLKSVQTNNYATKSILNSSAIDNLYKSSFGLFQHNALKKISITNVEYIKKLSKFIRKNYWVFKTMDEDLKIYCARKKYRKLNMTESQIMLIHSYIKDLFYKYYEDKECSPNDISYIETLNKIVDLLSLLKNEVSTWKNVSSMYIKYNEMALDLLLLSSDISGIELNKYDLIQYDFSSDWAHVCNYICGKLKLDKLVIKKNDLNLGKYECSLYVENYIHKCDNDCYSLLVSEIFLHTNDEYSILNINFKSSPGINYFDPHEFSSRMKNMDYGLVYGSFSKSKYSIFPYNLKTFEANNSYDYSKLNIQIAIPRDLKDNDLDAMVLLIFECFFQNNKSGGTYVYNILSDEYKDYKPIILGEVISNYKITREYKPPESKIQYNYFNRTYHERYEGTDDDLGENWDYDEFPPENL